VRIEPAEGFLHRVAVLYAVDFIRHDLFRVLVCQRDCRVAAKFQRCGSVNFCRLCLIPTPMPPDDIGKTCGGFHHIAALWRLPWLLTHSALTCLMTSGNSMAGLGLGFNRSIQLTKPIPLHSCHLYRRAE
jgi:hypothetical protein